MDKRIYTFIFLVTIFVAYAQQQDPAYLVDVKYENEVYATALTWDLKEVNLYADMYVPDRDRSELTPLVIFVSDAYFTSTEASSEAWDDLARYVASCGFVVANIQYRQGMSPDLDQPIEDEFVKAMSRASKDVYSAIAYFREDAINGANYYNIDPDRVLLLGYSSGAMAALHAGKYYADTRASTERLMRLIRQVGGWDDNIKKDELRRSIRAVVSIAGGVVDLNMYAPQNRTPVLLIEAENDSVIPSESGEMVVSGVP
ncbi:MAG: carboxylesterase family protein, partial [Cryomorphaceae bacterium]|nr:carboxylesterase family protein [Cryomorphaceae bacterium]